MSETRKSIYSAMVVIASTAAIYVGLRVREHSDLGAFRVQTHEASISHMLASRTNDINVPASDYFYELSQKLKEQYVEPVSDDQKLASGAIRGMIATLGDPDSVFMDRQQFSIFLNQRQGKYEGIGADLVLSLPPSSPTVGITSDAPADISADEALAGVREIPKVLVASVVPGGPADKAGVKVGDVVDTIDDHWVVRSDLIRKFRIASKKFNDKKISRLELEKLRVEIRTKFERSIFPGKAKERLMAGKSGVVSVTWNRNGQDRKTRITKAVSTLPGFGVTNNVIRLPFVEGSADKLASAIKGKTSITLDLRNNTLGDVQEMKRCLETVAPAGEYGYFVTLRHDKPTPLVVAKGSKSTRTVRLIADASTRGVAAAFCEALVSHNDASYEPGSGLVSPDRNSRQIVQLPDGSGYTLVTSVYRPNLNTALAFRKGAVK